MISYNLKCINEHEFEAWFKDADNFDYQCKNKYIECPFCVNDNTTKQLSAPNITTSNDKSNIQSELFNNAHKIKRQIHNILKKNCDDVGDNFANEARKIHSGKSKDRAIYGKATADETKELIKDGIEFTKLPWIDDKKKN